MVVDNAIEAREARDLLVNVLYSSGIRDICDASLSDPLQDDNQINVKIAQRFRKVGPSSIPGPSFSH
jgi:hypothetical protein